MTQALLIDAQNSPLEGRLKHLFSAFPGGYPGIALLLLRAVLGAVLSLHGLSYLREPNPTATTWLVGLVAFLASGLLMIGFLTPVAAIVVALGGVGIMLSIIPNCAQTPFDSKASLVFAATMLLNILLLGPGAYSLDARRFGRREIIIPRS